MDDKKKDIEEDKKLAKFLDEIYQKLELKIERLSYEKNPEMQQKGVDIIENRKDKRVYIDEKARQQSSNAKSQDKTFAFEITAFPVKDGSKIQGSNPYNGWFIDQNQLSEEYHLIVNIKKDKNTYTDCDIYKVKKSNIKDALTNLGLTDINILSHATTLRNDIELKNKLSFYKRSQSGTGYIYNLLELRQNGRYCAQCCTPLISQKGKYGQYLECAQRCKPNEKFSPNYGLMFYTDKKYDGSPVPELPINLVLNLDFLINKCQAEKIF